MTELIMPKMGDAMEEGILLEWLRKEGDKVKSGEVIGTIQTDKATLELEATTTGTLAGFLVKGGETVPVGKPIAAILKEGEALPKDWGKNGSAKPAPAAEAAPRQQPGGGGATEGASVQQIPAEAATQAAPRQEEAANLKTSG